MPKSRRFRQMLACHLVLSLLLSVPVQVWSQPQPSGISGFILGRVYEIDQAKYAEYRALLQKRQEDPENVEELDPDDYLVDQPDVVVMARHLASNQSFRSDFTNVDGEYLIDESPAGVFEFTLLYEEEEYSVSQRLDLNVELSYVAELCFVLDKEQKVGWMIAEGLRRDRTAPPFVPDRCQSSLSACLAMLVGSDGGFPDGLLLLLAGAGAAAATIGILSTGQNEASPPRQK